jgi:2-oxoglutarate ferredoxin oxidoreductase subunit alpha
MTATSGPGLSLMSEFAGLAYFAEVPVVIWDVQRVGPSTGLPTRTAQCDLNMAHFIGHGDTQNIVLLPGSVNECFEFGWRALNIAEQMQAPVFVLSDLDFGMNQWMTEPFEYPNEPIDRGKVIWEGDLESVNGDWGRYRDVDGDGIPYRTLPGNRHTKAAYFARGTGHNEQAFYSEDSATWYKLMERLKRKFDTAREFVPPPKIMTVEDAEIGIIAFGSTDPAVREACDQLAEAGLKAEYLRMRAIPFTKEVDAFMEKFSRIYVVEMNRDGQLHQLLTVHYPQKAMNLISIAYQDGLPLTARFVREAIQAKEAE